MFQLLGLLPTILSLMNNPAIQQLITALTNAGSSTFPGVDPNKAAQAGAALFDPEHIKWVQTALVLLGRRVDVDGAIGSGTKDAVSAFQTQHDLVADGWPGPKTADKLRAELLLKAKSQA